MTVRHLAVPRYTVPAAGAVAFRSLSNTTYASRTNTTVTAPAGVTNNDVMIMRFLQGRVGLELTVTPPAGWTEIGTVTDIESAGFHVYSHLYYRVASSEGASYTFTHASVSSQAVVAAYSGVNTTTPLDATPTANSGLSSTSTALGLTTVTAAAMLVFVEHDFGDIAAASSPPTGLTERLDVDISYWADAVQASAGASGNKTMTNSNTGANGFATRLVALRPA